ncbi:hypothetical protein ACO22_07253 [Paracoccidioides brasiliensis]|uniref:YTH domain-containing protein n=1 Tax=Paracoccidioides brasiliensis TaxID=121759 RepID=A0A1D2J565_PARBR|nr:hypothetical protein ACO22_07253 [Paracoccidioides brasiliensis]
MQQHSALQSGDDNRPQPQGPGVPTAPSISGTGRLPVQHSYYPVPQTFNYPSTTLYIQAAPPYLAHDTWNSRRYDETYNHPTIPGTLGNQPTSQQTFFYNTTLHALPQPAYYGPLLHTAPRWQSFLLETIHYDQNRLPMWPLFRNSGNPGNLNYVRPTQEPPHRTIAVETAAPPTAHYAIVDGSASISRAAKIAQPLPIERGGNIMNTSTPQHRSPILRGPPRKPKQSGYALWVGNLPSQVNIVDLKDHFSQDATEEIESVFLISNSKCAFVNYKTEAGCITAVTRFHDSRFQGIRLVCRFRRSASSDQNNIRALSPPRPETTNPPVNEFDKPQGELGPTYPSNEVTVQVSATKHPERYFIVKSLTIEDLERSRISGVWATQRHNESALNRAYETSEVVYLIFSANKSGEYFGYGRMTSPIPTLSEPNGNQETVQGNNSVTASEFLIVTPTPATETAPAGYIVNDPARGTIFWEIDRTDGADEANADGPTNEDDKSKMDSQSFGRPFNVEWLCWRRLPFHRTKGLRNPWNANKEVKIARDGTEIEPSVGRRLINLFDQML